MPFYGTSIICTIKNLEDLKPLLNILRRKNIVIVKNLNYRFFDIFSQTLHYITNGSEKCGALEN